MFRVLGGIAEYFLDEMLEYYNQAETEHTIMTAAKQVCCLIH
ncbi:hypothetical protein [Desulfosporosinus burensis]